MDAQRASARLLEVRMGNQGMHAELLAESRCKSLMGRSKLHECILETQTYSYMIS
jgi:hypothetical protein